MDKNKLILSVLGVYVLVVLAIFLLSQPNGHGRLVPVEKPRIPERMAGQSYSSRRQVVKVVRRVPERLEPEYVPVAPVTQPIVRKPPREYGNPCRPSLDASSPSALQESLGWSLWTFRSSVWNGYIDFQGNGRYWTHWGYGRWQVTDDGIISMVNEYDSYRHTLRVSPDGRHYEGERSDGVRVTGDLICGDYPGPIPSSPGLDRPREVITGYYREILGREPDPGGLQYWLNVYQNGRSLEDIKQGFYNSAEYQTKQNRMFVDPQQDR